jgi:hypothetical protein
METSEKQNIYHRDSEDTEKNISKFFFLCELCVSVVSFSEFSIVF